MLIGITGKSCAGKDFICQIFLGKGYREINLDTIGHMALELKQQAVREAFPELAPEISNSENTEKTINRKKLGSLVFRNPAALHKLEEILHPLMKKLALKELDSIARKETMNCRTEKIVINSALLEKLELIPYCDLVLWIHSSLFLRACRAIKRDKLSLLQFLRRNRAQHVLSYTTPKEILGEASPSWYRINNNSLVKRWASATICKQLRQIPQLRQEF